MGWVQNCTSLVSFYGVAVVQSASCSRFLNQYYTHEQHSSPIEGLILSSFAISSGSCKSEGRFLFASAISSFGLLHPILHFFLTARLSIHCQVDSKEINHQRTKRGIL